VTCKSYDIPKTLVWEAWLHVKANQGAAGIDAETIERFETKLAANLYKLWNRMSSGSYFPPPVKGVPIPKKTGGVRVLGVPTVSDRIAQTAVKMWLEPRLDPLFHDDSYGYRPGKSALEAIAHQTPLLGPRLGGGVRHPRAVRQSRSRPPDDGSAQALSGTLDPALRRALAESADANRGRAASGARQGHAARRRRVADSWPTCSCTTRSTSG